MKTPLILAALTAVCVAYAQNKPAVKPAQTQPLLGTAQLPGDDGKIGRAYTMGASQKLNFVLTGVRYTKIRWNVGGNSMAPDRNEKLLILGYQIQNPNKEIIGYSSSSLKFTAIDQENENHEFSGGVLQKNGDRDLSIDLKPAQRIDCEAAIIVPAKGVIPKLMVAHRTGGGVLRYDLHDLIKPLEKPFSENGSDAAGEIKGEPGVYYPLLQYDVKYASTAFQEKTLGNNSTDDKHVFMLSKMTFKKQSNTGHILRFEGEAVDEDGDRYPSTGIRKASSEDHMGSTAEFGQEVSGRMSFLVPKGVKIAKVRVWEYQGDKSFVVEYPVDLYATADGQPLGGAKKTAGLAAETGVPADEYATTFRKADGTVAMEVSHVERREGEAKTTEIVVDGKRAFLLEEADATTLFLPDTNETLRAPKAQDKEPVTSLAYYAMAYANATAPKPKKRNPFGDLGKALLDGGADSLGRSIMSSDSMSNFGKIAAGKVVEDATQRTLTHQLGRAVMTSAQPLSGGGRNESIVVDKKTYAETSFKSAKSVDPASMKVDASTAKSVGAKDLYKRFAEFMNQGLK